LFGASVGVSTDGTTAVIGAQDDDDPNNIMSRRQASFSVGVGGRERYGMSVSAYSFRIDGMIANITSERAINTA
jgi:Ca2+-binding RTX toxin-like protein